MGMNDNTHASGLQLGPSLLPATEATQTRQQRRSMTAPGTGSPVAAGESIGKKTAVRVRDIRLTGIAPGIRPEVLRREVATAVRRLLDAPDGIIRRPRVTQPLRHDASLQEVANALASAIVREAAHRQEAAR